MEFKNSGFKQGLSCGSAKPVLSFIYMHTDAHEYASTHAVSNRKWEEPGNVNMKHACDKCQLEKDRGKECLLYIDERRINRNLSQKHS